MIPDYIEPLKPDDFSRTAFSADVCNEWINVCNAIRRLTVVGGTVKWGDSNVVLQMNSGSLGHGGGGGGGTTTTIYQSGGDSWL